MDATRTVVSSLQADSSALLLVSEDSEFLLPVALFHVDAARRSVSAEALAARYRKSEGIAGRVWATGQAILISELDTRALEATSHTATRKFIRTTSLSSLIAVPLFHDRVVVGVLTAGRDSGSSNFTENDLEKLHGLAAQVSAALRTASGGP
jgi:transcriptional regulator with GAF, ATPase, and Fis domain